MERASKIASILVKVASRSGVAVKRAGHRLYQIYIRPVRLMEEVRENPDASAPAILITVGFTLQTLIVCALLSGVKLSLQNAPPVDLLSGFYSNLPTYVLLRGISLFAVWFILFIIYWFVMYILGSRVEGFTVFSAVGYTLSCQLLTFAAVLALYIAAASMTPSITLVGVRGVYPQLFSLAAHRYRLDVESTMIGVPVQGLIDGFEYFGSIWSTLLTLLTFRIVGELPWKKAIGGGLAAAAAAWFIAGVFRIAGLI
ncbi:MAG: hypothetical protein DRJ96_00175 [Thermoprotei archaeon]|nr:MAG: hypothetical protein DRJ96_00175 [Thermoprotei archaeon]